MLRDNFFRWNNKDIDPKGYFINGYAGKDSLDDICTLLNRETAVVPEVSPRSHLKVVDFTKRKAQEPHILRL